MRDHAFMPLGEAHQPRRADIVQPEERIDLGSRQRDAAAIREIVQHRLESGQSEILVHNAPATAVQATR